MSGPGWFDAAFPGPWQGLGDAPGEFVEAGWFAHLFWGHGWVPREAP